MIVKAISKYSDDLIECVLLLESYGTLTSYTTPLYKLMGKNGTIKHHDIAYIIICLPSNLPRPKIKIVEFLVLLTNIKIIEKLLQVFEREWMQVK